MNEWTNKAERICERTSEPANKRKLNGKKEEDDEDDETEKISDSKE